MKKITLLRNEHKSDAVRTAILKHIENANTKLDEFEKRAKITLSDAQVSDLANGGTDEGPILAKIWPDLPEDHREPYLKNARIMLSKLKGLMDNVAGSYTHNVNTRLCVEVKEARLVLAPDIDAYLASIFEVAILTEEKKKAYEKAQEIVRFANELKAELGLRFDEFINYGKTEQELKPFGKLIGLLSQKIVGTDLSAEPQQKEFSKAKTEKRSIADEIANFNKYF